MIMTDWETLLKPCECAAQYTIELHGDGYALYYGRCNHRHGWNLINMVEPAWNFDAKHIQELLQLGDATYGRKMDALNDT
jgi:hypothetical protein